MEASVPPGEGAATLQPWASEYHQESRLPFFTDLANVLDLSHKAGATENRDDMDASQTANISDANINITRVAQAAIDYSPQSGQVSDMQSVKALLRNFLDEILQMEMEHSAYFDGLLSQWLDIWRRDRTHSLLIYLLGGEQSRNNCMLDFNDLEVVDKIRTRVLEQHCLQQGVCLYLARMTSAVNTVPDDTFKLKMDINLHEIRDLSGALLGNKPVAVRSESLLQTGMLEERYHQRSAPQNPYPSPTEATPSPQIHPAKSFQDWVSPSNVPLC